MTAESEIQKYLELLSTNAAAQTQTCISLSSLGAEVKEAVSALIELLGNENKTMREDVISALVQVGELAIPALIDKFKNGHQKWDGPAGTILRQIGKPALSALTELISQPYPTCRDEAGRVLGFICADHQVMVPALIQMIKDEDRATQIEAMYCISRIGPNAVEAAPVLIDMLRNDSNDLGRYAAEALGKIGRCSKEAIEALVDAWIHAKDRRHIYYYSLTALSDIGEPAIPYLTGIIAEGDETRAIKAATALSLIGDPAISGFRKLSKDSRVSVRLIAVAGLGRIGEHKNYAPQALVEALHDEDEEVRFRALDWLGTIYEKAPVPGLVETLKDNEMHAMVSRRIRELGRGIISILTEALNDDELHPWATEMLDKVNTERGCRR